MCLFKYSTTMDFMLNHCGVSPFLMFSRVEHRVRAMSPIARRRLRLRLKVSDLVDLVPADQISATEDALGFDDAVWRLTVDRSLRVIYSGRIALTPFGSIDTSRDGSVRHYLLSYGRSAIHAAELSQDLSALYERQGLPAIHCHG
jgi:hypothetical protein